MLRRRSLLIAAVAIVTTGCVGATDRADFDAEVRARGGGVTSAWITEAIDLVATEVGAVDRSELSVMTVRITTTSRSVVTLARRADRPDFVDTVVVREGAIIASSPMQDADQLPLDDITIPVEVFPLDELESISDRALDEFDEADGFVDSIALTFTNGEPAVEVEVNSSRRTGSVRFDVDGNFLEIQR